MSDKINVFFIFTAKTNQLNFGICEVFPQRMQLMQQKWQSGARVGIIVGKVFLENVSNF